MAINLGTFRTQVRKTAGAPGVCEIDDACIDAKIKEAIKKLSRLNPRRVVEQVTFSANDPNADFPSDCFGIDNDVEISEGAGLVNSSSVYFGASNLAGYGYQHSLSSGASLMSTVPALTDVRMFQHVDEFAEQTFPSLSFQERGGMIYVQPPPSTQQTYHVPLLKFHTEATFPSSLEDQLEDLAAGLIFYLRAAKYKILEMSAADGRQKIKFGNIRAFFKSEGDRLVDSVADVYSITRSMLG